MYAASADPFQEMLAEFCEGHAEWRDGKAEEYPDDSRNAASAKTLRQFAGWVRGLPHDGVDLARLKALTARCEASDGMMAFSGEEASRVVARIGFSHLATFEGYLAGIVSAAERDIVALIGN
jgi:hypothetical protein